MLYRIVKRATWWTTIFDNGLPQFLYYDYDLDHFEVAGYQVARRYKWLYTKEEIDQFLKDFNLDDEFLIEQVRDKRR